MRTTLNGLTRGRRARLRYAASARDLSEYAAMSAVAAHHGRVHGAELTRQARHMRVTAMLALQWAVAVMWDEVHDWRVIGDQLGLSPEQAASVYARGIERWESGDIDPWNPDPTRVYIPGTRAEESEESMVATVRGWVEARTGLTQAHPPANPKRTSSGPT